ncbi:hypothetical protein JT358_11505 [Micrococcales bacterium 31B]|nr:hypothetical protein [Micrococcales bacterium 31B]
MNDRLTLLVGVICFVCVSVVVAALMLLIYLIETVRHGLAVDVVVPIGFAAVAVTGSVSISVLMVKWWKYETGVR